jgi:hypothetical protein
VTRIPPAGVAAAAVLAVVALAALVLNPFGPRPSGSPATGSPATGSPSIPPSASVPASTGPPTIVPPLEWSPITGAPLFRAQFSQAAAAVYRGEIWLVGAEGANRFQNQVEIFDPRREEWRDGPELPISVRHASLVSDGPRLYVMGGYLHDEDDDDPAISDVYRLDRPDGEWVKLARGLPAPRLAGAAAWDGERIVFGGGASDLDIRAASSDVWAFDGSQWTPLDPLQSGREHLAAASDGVGHVWFVGGVNAKADNPSGAIDLVQGGETTPEPALAVGRQGAAATWSPNTGLCILGGSLNPPAQARRRANYLDLVECRGGELPALPLERYGPAAVVIGNTVYVLGGFDEGDPDLTVEDAVLKLGLP